MNEFDMLNNAYFRNASFSDYNMIPESSLINQPIIQQPMHHASQQNLFNPMDAYEKGTLFKDLFQPYKNYMPQRLNPTTEQQEMMNMLNAYDFYAHELNLYLDLFPTNENYIRLFNEYSRKTEELTREYEKKYGPIVVNSDESALNPWAWNNGPWPWQRR